MYYIKQPLQKILLFKYMWIWHKQLAKTDNFDSKVKRKKKHHHHLSLEMNAEHQEPAQLLGMTSKIRCHLWHAEDLGGNALGIASYLLTTRHTCSVRSFSKDVSKKTRQIRALWLCQAYCNSIYRESQLSRTKL